MRGMKEKALDALAHSIMGLSILFFLLTILALIGMIPLILLAAWQTGWQALWVIAAGVAFVTFVHFFVEKWLPWAGERIGL